MINRHTLLVLSMILPAAASQQLAAQPGSQPMVDINGHMGIGTVQPHSSALLDLTSLTAGLLLPRTTPGMIASPTPGLVIYNTATNQLNVYTGNLLSPWEEVVTSGGGDVWLTDGNAAAPGDVLGTTNAQDLNIVAGNVIRMIIDDVTGNVGIGGAPTLGDRLSVSGNLLVSGNTNVNGTLNAAGATTLNGNVTLGDAAADAVTLTGTLTGPGSGHSLGTSAVDATVLTIQGANGGANELVVNGDASIAGTLTTGTLALTGNLDMNGNDIVDVDDLQFSQATSDISNTGGDVVINDNAAVTGTTDLQGQVGNTLGDLQLADNVDVTGDLDVGAGNFTVAAATGNTDVGGTLNVDGATTLVGTTDAQSAISSSTGDVTINDNVVVTGTSDLQGQVGSTLGDLQLADNVDITGDLDVGAGNFTVAAATGNTDVGGTLNVDGASTLVGAVDMQAAGNVVGDGTDAEQLEVQGVDGGAVEVDVNGDMDVSGTLTVGTLAFSGNLDMNGNDIVDVDDLQFSQATSDISNTGGDVVVNDNLSVTGSATFGDDATPTAGTVVLNDNTSGNGFEGTVQTVAALTADRTYTLPDASGTLALTSDIVVTTDATLTGDGTGGNPLSLNEANANTWTATQTLPVTAAQGDALIASTNAGTTTVDAARIGAGLTDAQVNDNLTINGGTVDATPVGATTPSTGAFTTITGTALPAASTATDIVVSNAGALETRTIGSLAGNVAVSTDATLTGDGTTGNPLSLNEANANTWTATQTLPVTAAQGDALIASTNAGTTTVDAARIGAGLTDAQVNDNLTINGGTVDATPVGATTPSTGAFTTLTGTSSITLGDDATPTAGTVVLNDNTSGNGFEGTVQTAAALTADRTYTLPDASGTLALTADIVVNTNATLDGDGTLGDPLTINLANANTWTATQTLPVTAAQGDALIASTNAGTTTVDAARIGAGLTDAQVNDNLTINGGTVDATPVGATTPSTGAFTTLTGNSAITLGDDATPTAGTVVLNDNTSGNGFEGTVQTAAALTADRTYTLPDASGTLALTADIVVNTNATLDGDGTLGDPLTINLANANTWTATQTLPVTAAQGDALIASTNAGTTTVDAARIGAGLTDAQVNDNLTINGGTVDATPVGATTPSTGAFTTLTGTSSITLGDDATPTAGTVVLNDNTSGNGFEGTVQTAAALTADRTYTLPDASGTLALTADIVVNTNATLDGDGTLGDPLTINLANANTWTATQTLPVTAAQGDALIASTNAGTTTVDAARIGAGLTDAQVNDNLTINGGTVDATPVGATTPSTGAFTTITGTALPAASTATDIVVSNAGALETRTIGSLAGNVAVSTDATLTGDGTTGNPLSLNEANANTWTATQTLPVTAAQGDALIASTNAGTTTVDAARIGAGLTDAQVNDNLTINGGTVDATPVGATTPSTGAFTTLTATGAIDLQGTVANSAGNVTINDNIDITGNIIPTADATYDLGSATNRWDELYVSGPTIHIGSNADEGEISFDPSTGLELDGNDDGTADLMIDGATGDVEVAGDLNVTGTFTAPGFSSSPAGLDLNGGDIVDVDDLEFSQATSDISNTGGNVVVNDNLDVTGAATFGDDATPTAGTLTLHDNTSGNGFEGTVQTAAALTADRTYTLPDASGTLALTADIVVNTNATLDGDGTLGDPLTINLANANTWTATQTLPVTAAQGDALIASTNAGTTTVDAARIGAGLTNAQVNNDLTISGGSVDASPVGATTPSTGAFTTLTGNSAITLGDDATPTAGTVVLNDNTSGNGFEGTVQTAAALTADRTYTLPDASGTLALTADIVVNTNATLDGDGTLGDPLTINLANANTWTATQTLPVTAAQGDALIASTNAGTTTVDAARIGAGLTNAQVNNDLTISGGSVDATPVGATTPSTGAFTTLTGNSAITLGDDATPTAGTVVLNDNTSGNGFEGTVQTAAALTADRTYTLPDASGTLALTADIVVNTNATLDGDGTLGDPLTINLANANTWTATQTLPVTAAQGDALIASTNAGTTTVDAARIGAGLTDAQVNDNLTINGGTVDATPVGATTPSTGAFTTITGTALPAASTATDIVVSNAGALETRTIGSLAGNVAVSTDATLTGDGTTGNPLSLNEANANTWTATQTLPVTAAQGDALIASTNAGTTTVDAARIGAGLTDAQVNDNLTINGGTVDATPVGATTPSTGAFTTLTGTSSITLGDDATPTAGTVVLNDNTSGNGFEGTVQTAAALTADRTYTLPDASGTLALTADIVVNTNATLDGDGTLGDPLTINLANANTWTATQTLPVTAAQGDALIASTNAGTTTVDAARIGAGLTDAQVNDNLTINGGTVDATPVGATTPSTGAFTTLTGTSSITLGDDATPTAGTVVLNDNTSGNGFEGTVQTAAALTADRTYTLPDASGTLALTADIVVNTNATLDGDGTLGDPLTINLANANTWTATQTLPVTAAQGDALIASTNAGTTTVDAARIGAGLTDAQVNDNLTINGGTVDATPVGATTPSTGAFTTITGNSAITLGDDATPTAGTVVLNDNTSGNGFEGTVQTAAALTADRTYTLPDASGTLALTADIVVNTNATLDGDGTFGDPLTINLANANTWTATQTLPVTAAQGDALIASTNAGTTTVDAARIGAGLTDAQVNDNLTINGGTVDATPVGATTPSTGAFTTLGALGATDLQGTISNSTGRVTISDDVDIRQTLFIGDDVTPTQGLLVIHDNTSGNGFEGTLETATTLTDDRSYILPDNSGTVALTSDISNLTDAQINDNLTISAGSVDNSPIGATTPNTGAFTTITGGSSLTLGDDATPTAGSLVLLDNTSGNGFEGTITTDAALTADRGYTLPDASGTLALTSDITAFSNSVWTNDGDAITTGGTGGGEQFLGTTNNQPLVFATNTSEAMRVTTGQDLVVGTSTSSGRLTVRGSTTDNTANGLLVENSAGTDLLKVDNSGQVTLRNTSTVTWGSAGLNGNGATLNLRGDIGSTTSGTINALAQDIFMEADGTGSNVQMLAGYDLTAGDFSSAVLAQGDPTGGGVTSMISQKFSGGGTADQTVSIAADASAVTATIATIDNVTPANAVTMTMTNGVGVVLTAPGQAFDVTSTSIVAGDFAVRGNASGAGTAVTGVAAIGNATTTDANTNIALDVREGELVVPRQATAAANAGGANLIVEDDATAGDNGPSGVVDVTDGGIAGAATVTTGTLVVFNHYVKANSIILLTPMDGGTAVLDPTELMTWSVSGRGAGTFTINVNRANLAAPTGGTSGTFRFGFLVINPGK